MIMRAEIFIFILILRWKVDCVDIVVKLFCQDLILNILALNQMLNS